MYSTSHFKVNKKTPKQTKPNQNKPHKQKNPLNTVLSTEGPHSITTVVTGEDGRGLQNTFNSLIYTWELTAL